MYDKFQLDSKWRVGYTQIVSQWRLKNPISGSICYWIIRESVIESMFKPVKRGRAFRFAGYGRDAPLYWLVLRTWIKPQVRRSRTAYQYIRHMWTTDENPVWIPVYLDVFCNLSFSNDKISNICYSDDVSNTSNTGNVHHVGNFIDAGNFTKVSNANKFSNIDNISNAGNFGNIVSVKWAMLVMRVISVI